MVPAKVTFVEPLLTVPLVGDVKFIHVGVALVVASKAVTLQTRDDPGEPVLEIVTEPGLTGVKVREEALKFIRATGSHRIVHVCHDGVLALLSWAGKSVWFCEGE